MVERVLPYLRSVSQGAPSSGGSGGATSGAGGNGNGSAGSGGAGASAGLLSAADVDSVASHWVQLRQVHRELGHRLDERAGAGAPWTSASSLGDAFDAVLPYLRLYVSYTESFEEAVAVVRRWRQSATAAPHVLHAEQTFLDGQSLQAVLALPVRPDACAIAGADARRAGRCNACRG